MQGNYFLASEVFGNFGKVTCHREVAGQDPAPSVPQAEELCYCYFVP